MNEIDVKRLDHYGIVVATFDALGLVNKISDIIRGDPQEVLSPGQVVKAMVLAGLGF